MSNVDFVQLAQQAYTADGAPSRDDQNKLWAALFGLDHWLFLMTPKSMADMTPSVQSIDGEAWMLVFTDSDHLHRYATRNQNLDESGKSLYLTVTPEGALEFLSGYEGTQLTGVRFNEGAESGWYSPLRNLPLIRDHLAREGLYTPKSAQ